MVTTRGFAVVVDFLDEELASGSQCCHSPVGSAGLLVVLRLDVVREVLASGSQCSHSPVGSAGLLLVVRFDVVLEDFVLLEVRVEVVELRVEVRVDVRVDVRDELDVCQSSHGCSYMPLVVAQLVG